MSDWSVGSDHAGFELKEALKAALASQGLQVTDRGCYSTDSVDYPDHAALVARDVAARTSTQGLLICGTGIGISISANKVNGIRAALCHNRETAEMARAHNNANILCIGARVVSEETARDILQAFVNTAFESGRHQRRINKIHDIESS